MQSSPTVQKIAEALLNAQNAMKSAKKSAENPYFDSKYANFESVWNACHQALSANELVVTQTVNAGVPDLRTNECTPALETTLIHLSGEWIKSSIPLVLVKKDMQAMGSAITYARRYGLAAICGVTQEDDDGNRATTVDVVEATKVPTGPVKTALKKADKALNQSEDFWS